MSDVTPLFRQWTVLKMLASRRHGMTVPKLAEETDVSQKTIRRDLQKFQQLGFPLEESEGEYNRKTWRVSASWLEPQTNFTFDEKIVISGGRLRDDVVPLDDETPERRSMEVSSDRWGIFGKVDALRRRDGVWVAYEHKRGRCRRGPNKEPLAWSSDRIQAIAYAVLIEEEVGEPVPQARVRYHADNVTAFVEVDEQARQDLAQAIERARELRRTPQRPPITENENLCRRCSLAPVCLLEEERLVEAKEQWAEDGEQKSGNKGQKRPVPTLFPSDRQRQTLHVVSPKGRVGRSRETLTVATEEETQRLPISDIDAVVVHGFDQVSTQAVQLCARHGISIQWFTAGGRFMAGTSASPGKVQQRIRQYESLTKPENRSATSILTQSARPTMFMYRYPGLRFRSFHSRALALGYTLPRLRR